MRYLIDSNVLIDVLRGNPGAVDYLDSLDHPWGLSQATALELVVGGRNKRHTAIIDRFISNYAVVPLSESIGSIAYRLVCRYARSHGLHVFDALIAATALELGLTLVSLNRRHYHMIEELRLHVPND